MKNTKEYYEQFTNEEMELLIDVNKNQAEIFAFERAIEIVKQKCTSVDSLVYDLENALKEYEIEHNRIAEEMERIGLMNKLAKFKK